MIPGSLTNKGHSYLFRVIHRKLHHINKNKLEQATAIEITVACCKQSI